MHRMMIAAVMALAGAAFGQASERMSHAALMDLVQKAVGPKSAEEVRLTELQQREIAAAHEAFKRNAMEFLRRHAAGTLKGEMNVPSAEAVERRIMELLNKKQLEAIEKAKKADAEKRAAQRHSVRSSDSSSQTSSQSSSQSSNQSSSDSSSQRSSDRQSSSDRKSDSKSERKEDSHKSRTWSSLDAKQQAAAVHDLMNQLPAKDREALAKELKARK